MRIVGVALMGVAVATIVWEPWHGPIVITLSSSHGIDAGNVFAVPLVVASVLVSKAAGGPARGPASFVRVGSWRWSGPCAAMVLGGLLVVVGTVSARTSGPLLPAGGGTFGRRVTSAPSDEPVAVDTWAYVAATYDGAALRLYVDGRLVASRDVAGPMPHSTLPLWIGGNRPYGEHFDGVIDELRVYARTLSPAELAVDRATPIAAAAGVGVPPGLVGAYSFDVGTGGVVHDLSRHGNVGELLGATWTPEGRFRGALRFDGSSATVRVAASPSLDLGTAMTLSAWIKPASEQSGWRTIVQREPDDYFLDASSDGPHGLGRFDDAVAAIIVVAAVWLAMSLAGSDGGWLGARRRRSLGIAGAAALLGATVDALLAPSGSALAVMLLALWLAASATIALEAVAFALVAAGCAVVTWTSLSHGEMPGVRLAADDGGAARAALLGALLVVTGLLRFAGTTRPGAGRPTTG